MRINVAITNHAGEKKMINGSPFKVSFEEPTEETKGLNSLDGNVIVNWIKETCDEIRNFIIKKNEALNLETQK